MIIPPTSEVSTESPNSTRSLPIDDFDWKASRSLSSSSILFGESDKTHEPVTSSLIKEAENLSGWIMKRMKEKAAGVSSVATSVNKIVLQYKQIETPKNIWDKAELDEILSFEDLQHGFDDVLRQNLEYVSKFKFKPVEAVNMTKINDYLEKCKYLEILKMTIDHKLDSDNVDTALEAA